MANEILIRAIALADAYARRRAFFAAHPFTRKKDEREAEKARDDARAELQSFLAAHLGVLGTPASPIHGDYERRITDLAPTLGMARAVARADLELDEARADGVPVPCPLCGYQHGHAIGCANNPVDVALARGVGEVDRG